MSTLANLVVELIERDAFGIYNVGSRHGMSKAEFALLMAKHLNIPDNRIKADKSPSGRAPRAKDLRLDVTKVETLLRREMPTLAEEIGKI